jgi:hypothetical protein
MEGSVLPKSGREAEVELRFGGAAISWKRNLWAGAFRDIGGRRSPILEDGIRDSVDLIESDHAGPILEQSQRRIV